MKTTILSIAAAAAITVATAGAASAAGPVAKPGLFEGGAAKVQTVDYRYGGLRRRLVEGNGYRNGYGYGNGYGNGIGHRIRCRRLYYRGYVLGNPFARRLFNRFCTYRHGYRYGGGYAN